MPESNRRKRSLDDDYDGDSSQGTASKRHHVDENLLDGQNGDQDHVMDYNEVL